MTIYGHCGLALVSAAALAITGLQPALAKKTQKVALAKNSAVVPDSRSARANAGKKISSQAKVSGFRSAKFGMSEAQLRSAIARDFGLKKSQIKVEVNKQERTKILAAKVKDLLPGGGTAKVSYVMGYKSNRLIQVSAVWSAATDEKLTAEQLFSNGNVLQRHFTGGSYEPKSIAMNLPTNGGLIMFRGADAQKRSVLLMLRGQYRQTKDRQRLLTPSSLMLFYVADAEKPDIYRLPKGSF